MINKIFPLTLHFIVTASIAGLAVGLHHVTPVNVLAAYTTTGAAIGLGITALARFIVFLDGQ